MFKFNGISNTDMKVIPKEENFTARAPQRFETITIDGKDGVIFIPLGYEPVEKDLELQILDISNIPDILEWLNGEGELEYENKVSQARFFAGYDVDRFVSLKKAQISYIRDPFWYKANDDYITVTTSVINGGNIYAKPLIKLTGSGMVDISVNGTRFQYTFTDPYVEIDCEDMTEKYEGLIRSRNMEMGLEYPRLDPGTNEIILNSGTCTIEMMRKDRWL
ncbi:phage tail domain-containing protein [Alkalibacter mobilis]|uniref:phage tail domain-containing protein n=1 Tax=Alkalibacter mobilis TaxID=2787712 RepID=UPI00189CFC07|nr:phage tail domain-containing protein [Alkalibacter mobilis]MBF7097574.1 phage tail family protein [Alkalibacter mobilis]